MIFFLRISLIPVLTPPSTISPAWIVAMLGGDNEAQTYLEYMLKAMESFYHPSNYGRWSSGLLKFMNKLATQFVKRLHRERYQETNWEPLIPKDKKLTEDNVTRFVKSLLPVRVYICSMVK